MVFTRDMEFIIAYNLGLQISRKFHFHEYPARGKWHKYAEKSDAYQENSVKFRCRRTVRLIQYDEAQASHREQETGG